MISTTSAELLDDLAKDLDLIFDGHISAAEIDKQRQRFAGLVRQVNEPREGLQALAKRPPKSIARNFRAIDRVRAFSRDVTDVSFITNNDELLEDLGLGSPDTGVIRAYLMDFARNIVANAPPSN